MDETSLVGISVEGLDVSDEEQQTAGGMANEILRLLIKSGARHDLCIVSARIAEAILVDMKQKKVNIKEMKGATFG